MARLFNKVYFDGAGEWSIKAHKKLHELLDEALSLLSASQQTPMSTESVEACKDYEKFVKKADRRIDEIADDIYCALTGINGVKLKCPYCKGTQIVLLGAAEDEDYTNCPHCKGQGFFIVRSNKDKIPLDCDKCPVDVEFCSFKRGQKHCKKHLKELYV